MKRITPTKKKTATPPAKKKEVPPVNKYAYKVEAGVAMEPRRRDFVNHFPFDQMNVGDSFLIPKGDNLVENPNGIHYAVKMYQREVKIGFTVTTRKLLDGSRRVWRIK